MILDEARPFHWSGAGRPLFGSSPGGTLTEDADGVAPSGDIDFKPIIDLPDLVEVKTGQPAFHQTPILLKTFAIIFAGKLLLSSLERLKRSVTFFAIELKLSLFA